MTWPADSRGPEEGEVCRFPGEEIRDGRLLMIGRDQDRAETILFFVDQAGVYRQEAPDFVQLACLDRVEKILTHLMTGFPFL